eukprot:CAMPEP_0181176604 /NCGR_PEP_ID=MMETSP1096-20121128/4717_1 /TAXON_ID=156174 ORGANISM="Chrysochromulina ericina, Strain CCMP281" /NCGR_SAMPLE_ID=MMETSP1096 /ASSEMBLY_ACC=CAM_ASM_000453 /LENGTH=80 /DNA_ID=CAMNT_0023264701 /DNA_START=388 /DNA_END=631 /DNA_ORIENTATION=+
MQIPKSHAAHALEEKSDTSLAAKEEAHGGAWMGQGGALRAIDVVAAAAGCPEHISTTTAAAPDGTSPCAHHSEHKQEQPL